MGDVARATPSMKLVTSRKAHQGKGPALLCLRCHVTDDKPVAATREAAVSDECALLAEPSTHDSACGCQHFRHAWAALGTLVPDDDHCPLCADSSNQTEQESAAVVR